MNKTADTQADKNWHLNCNLQRRNYNLRQGQRSLSEKQLLNVTLHQ